MDTAGLTQKAQMASLRPIHADVLLFTLDGRERVTRMGQEWARWLRQSYLSARNDDTRILVLCNKLEHTATHRDDFDDHWHEWLSLGLGEPLAISAIHGDGLADLAVILEEEHKRRMLLSEDTTEQRSHDEKNIVSSQDATNESDDKPLTLAILGRPNVGKSTLVNTLFGAERVLTGSNPGVTRDAVTIPWQWKDHVIHLVDTAGIRKPQHTSKSHSYNANDSAWLEEQAVQDAWRALQFSHVAVLVLDANARQLTQQDLRIAAAIVEEGRALVVVVNKMDTLLEEDYSVADLEKDVRDHLESRFPMLRKTPIVVLSALNQTSQDIQKALLPVVIRAEQRWQRKITTGQLNQWMAEIQKEYTSVSGFPKIKYMVQTNTRPPTFVLFSNHVPASDSYLRYLTRHFQDTFELYGMAVRLFVRRSKNPFVSASTSNKPSRGGSGLGGRAVRQERKVKALKSGDTGKRRRRIKRK
jgi:GTP-binding protein